HVYEITASRPNTLPNTLPLLTLFGNTKTNTNSIILILNTSETVTFNVKANQTITTWNWYNNGQAVGNNTNSYTVSFSTGGTKNISVSATNANGTSNMITWTVSVTSKTAHIYPRYDITESGVVDISDLTLVSQHFNEVITIPYPRYDVNMDGFVDIADLTIVSKHFGELT
ncbi:MAG: hypothetical protein J5U19_14895, partial [Candidatus Methanoperedens sp.]|nr:hypothetical protein [Candidatus Methanoperedens sp.]